MNFMPEAIVRRRYASGYLLVNYAEMEIIGNLLDWFEKNQNKKGKDV